MNNTQYRLHIFLALVLYSTLTLALFSIPEAFAQAAGGLSKLNDIMTAISTALGGVAVVTFTVCIMWAGYKMAFQGARWSDIVHIVIGGVLVAGAATIARMLLPGL